MEQVALGERQYDRTTGPVLFRLYFHFSKRDLGERSTLLTTCHDDTWIFLFLHGQGLDAKWNRDGTENKFLTPAFGRGFSSLPFIVTIFCRSLFAFLVLVSFPLVFMCWLFFSAAWLFHY